MKKTVILTFAALMAISVSSAAASTIYTIDASVLADKKPKKKKEIKEVTFNVYLHCEDCVVKVQENIAFEKGVKDLDVSLEEQTVAIKYDAAKTSEATLKAAIEKLGYPVTDEKQEHHDHNHHHDGHDHK